MVIKILAFSDDKMYDVKYYKPHDFYVIHINSLFQNYILNILAVTIWAWQFSTSFHISGVHYLLTWLISWQLRLHQVSAFFATPLTSFDFWPMGLLEYPPNNNAAINGLHLEREIQFSALALGCWKFKVLCVTIFVISLLCSFSNFPECSHTFISEFEGVPCCLWHQCLM